MLSSKYTPESVIRCQVYKKQSEWGWKGIDDPNYHALLVTESEFGCIFWEQNVEI
jgi:hypothetical protein